MTSAIDPETSGGAETGPLGPTLTPGPLAGFTLVEMLIVVMISGILIATVMPTIDAVRFQLDAGAMEVASTVASSRGGALLRQHDFVLTFDEAGQHLFVLNDANNDGVASTGEERRMVQLSKDVNFGRGGAPAIRGLTDAIAFTKVSEGLPALTFHRNGAASEEGILYLTSARASSGNDFPQDARALLVERATGRVDCRSYRTGQWLEGC